MRIEANLTSIYSRIFAGRDGTRSVDLVFVEGDTESAEEVSVCVTMSNELALSLIQKIEFALKAPVEAEDE